MDMWQEVEIKPSILKFKLKGYQPGAFVYYPFYKDGILFHFLYKKKSGWFVHYKTIYYKV